MTRRDEEGIGEQEAANQQDDPGALLKQRIDESVCLEDVTEANREAEQDVEDTHVDRQQNEVLEVGR
ncbi:MAG TPA: hypothetical protein EYQ80_07885, partial [Candidatus Poseidoniales archaeon]|nr:hypothetical protein [Candidatus Poseidoniales archaeon]